MIVFELKHYKNYLIYTEHFKTTNNKLTILNDLIYISNVEIIDNEYDDLLIRIKNGNTIYYLNFAKQYHNPDGPSVIHSNGNKQYWINNKRKR